MSEEQQKFDDLMKRVIKVSPEELKRRLAESKTIKDNDKAKSALQGADIASTDKPV
jgi:3-methyladenine DNA glycosylase Tag